MRVDFNHIPDGWKKLKIAKKLFFQEGPGVRKWQFTDKGIKLLNVGNINLGQVDLSATDKHLSTEEATGKYAHFLVDEGDLLIACSGIVVDNFHNKIAFAKKEHLPLCLNTSTMRFKALEDDVDLNYFKYFLQTVHFTSQLQKLITGSAQLNFGPSHIKKIDFLLPPIKTQKQIAQILDNAAALRDKTKQLLKEYDLLAQSIFLDMFGDPAINQKKWKIVKFGEVGKLDRGKSKHRPRNAPELMGGIYPLIQTGDVANCDGYITKFKSTYSEIGLAQSKLWPIGTLCITIAANIANTGILAIEACFPDSVVGFMPNKNTNTIFTKYWMSFLQEIIESNAPQAAQKNINLKILKELDFFCPPIELQNQFVEKIGLIEQQKELAKQELQESEDLFNCLLKKAFKGELV